MAKRNLRRVQMRLPDTGRLFTQEQMESLLRGSDVIPSSGLASLLSGGTPDPIGPSPRRGAESLESLLEELRSILHPSREERHPYRMRSKDPSPELMQQIDMAMEEASPDPKLRKGFKRLRQSEELAVAKARRLRDKMFAEYKKNSAALMEAAAEGATDPKALREIFQFRDIGEFQREMNDMVMDDLVKSGMTRTKAATIAAQIAEESKESFGREKLIAAFEEGNVPNIEGYEPAPKRARVKRSEQFRKIRTPEGEPQKFVRLDKVNMDDLGPQRTPKFEQTSDNLTADKEVKERPLFRGAADDPTGMKEASRKRFTDVSRQVNLEIDVVPTQVKGKKRSAPYTIKAVRSRTKPGMMEVTRVAGKNHPDASTGFRKDQADALAKIFGLKPETTAAIRYSKGRNTIRPLYIPIDQFYGALKGGTKKGTAAARIFGGLGTIKDYSGKDITKLIREDDKFLEAQRTLAKRLENFSRLPASEREAILLRGMDKGSLRDTIEETKRAVAKRAGFSRPQADMSGNTPLERNLRLMKENLEKASRAKARGERVGGGIKLPKKLSQRRPGLKFRGNPLASLLLGVAQSVGGGLRGGL